MPGVGLQRQKPNVLVSQAKKQKQMRFSSTDDACPHERPRSQGSDRVARVRAMLQHLLKVPR